MFPLHYNPTDFAAIVNYFLPILMAHKFDLYLCGHEHLLAYAEVSYTDPSIWYITEDRKL
jgi:hemolysin-activating ACP:hemolysin acyltransferase